MNDSQGQFQKRQVAHKIQIEDIYAGGFIKDESSAGYLRFKEMVVPRVNVIATIVDRPESGFASAVIDDGTGKIMLRSFDNKNIFSGLDIGEQVQVIGRVREFNNERYIMPETVKKLPSIDWISVRKIELAKANFPSPREEPAQKEEAIVEEIISPAEDVFSIIRRLDSGSGALIYDVIKESKKNDVEEIINNLLERGDIFEISPGKVKILE
jgi:RPA family protein